MAAPTSLFEQAVTAFRQCFAANPQLAVAAPGRANLIGEHTDYNEGHVLPIAIDRYLVAAAAPRADRTIRVHSTALGETFAFDPARVPADRPRWTSYVAGVAVELARDGHRLPGADLLVHGDLPIASGLSSSAALEIAVATALERLAGLEFDDARLVAACRRGDHALVGVRCGPMDQFAARACRAGHAGLLDCRSLELSHRRLPAAVEFLSIYSGIPRALAASEYNERQDSCRRAVAVLQAAWPEIRALRDATPEQLEARRGDLGERAYRRARHVVTEQQRVFAMVAALESGDAERAGSLLYEGHRSLAEDYEVSLPVLDEMVEWLAQQPGVLGARLTGAGFGGSLICMAAAGAVDEHEAGARFAERFAPHTPDRPALWKLHAVDGARHRPSFIP